jgi:uncharacterized membrane protein HdeD (DUF308 family)
MTATMRAPENVQTEVLQRMWWAMMLRAAAIVTFAFLAFFWTGRSLGGLTMLFAAYALADGVLCIAGAVRGGGLVARAGITLAGAAGIGAAAASLLPGLTWEALASIIAAWALARGACEFVSALTLRRYMERDWSLALIGMLSMMFGGAVFLRTGFDPWTFVRLLSAYSLITGLLMAMLAFRFLKGLRP